MKFASIVVVILAIILPIVSTTKLPDKSACKCPNPPGHERMASSTAEDVRLICLHHTHQTEE